MLLIHLSGLYIQASIQALMLSMTCFWIVHFMNLLLQEIEQLRKENSKLQEELDKVCLVCVYLKYLAMIEFIIITEC